jgi:hypothetical protein
VRGVPGDRHSYRDHKKQGKEVSSQKVRANEK